VLPINLNPRSTIHAVTPEPHELIVGRVVSTFASRNIYKVTRNESYLCNFLIGLECSILVRKALKEYIFRASDVPASKPFSRFRNFAIKTRRGSSIQNLDISSFLADIVCNLVHIFYVKDCHFRIDHFVVVVSTLWKALAIHVVSFEKRSSFNYPFSKASIKYANMLSPKVSHHPVSSTRCEKACSIVTNDVISSPNSELTHTLSEFLNVRHRVRERRSLVCDTVDVKKLSRLSESDCFVLLKRVVWCIRHVPGCVKNSQISWILRDQF